jgi:hypothetical protein
MRDALFADNDRKGLELKIVIEIVHDGPAVEFPTVPGASKKCPVQIALA